MNTCAKCGAPAVYGSDLCYAHGGEQTPSKEVDE